MKREYRNEDVDRSVPGGFLYGAKLADTAKRDTADTFRNVKYALEGLNLAARNMSGGVVELIRLSKGQTQQQAIDNLFRPETRCQITARANNTFFQIILPASLDSASEAKLQDLLKQALATISSKDTNFKLRNIYGVTSEKTPISEIARHPLKHLRKFFQDGSKPTILIITAPVDSAISKTFVEIQNISQEIISGVPAAKKSEDLSQKAESSTPPVFISNLALKRELAAAAARAGTELGK